MITTDRNHPGLKETLPNGQQAAYLVLSEEERSKGFKHPYRDAYRHLTCGTVTTMGRALSETYACNRSYYGATMCVGCRDHFPLTEFMWEVDGVPMDPAMQDEHLDKVNLRDELDRSVGESPSGS